MITMQVVADWWFGNILISAFITYTMEQIVIYQRNQRGEVNIAVKSQVDERFLV